MQQEPLEFNVRRPLPLLIVISGPSGVGKDAILQELMQRGLPLHFVVTSTTRPPRQNERDGVDYNFVSRDEFQRMIDADELIEYALVYQDYKGIPKSQVRQAMASGKDVILRVDVQGAARLRKLCPEAVLIFIVPTSQEEWLERLLNRQTETPESLCLRIETAQKEMDQLGLFDYVVENAQNCLQAAVDTIVGIIQAEHHHVHHRIITL